MRTYARNADGGWVVVETDANGNDDLVWVVTLAQVLKLNLGESPFYANLGIPAHQSVIQQILPDFYVTLTQQYFAPQFASLLISRRPGSSPPTYDVNAVTKNGIPLLAEVPT